MQHHTVLTTALHQLMSYKNNTSSSYRRCARKCSDAVVQQPSSISPPTIIPPPKYKNMKGMCIVNMCSATAQPLDNKSAQKGKEKEKGEHIKKFIHLVVTWLRCYKVSTTHAGTEKKS